MSGGGGGGGGNLDNTAVRAQATSAWPSLSSEPSSLRFRHHVPLNRFRCPAMTRAETGRREKHFFKKKWGKITRTQRRQNYKKRNTGV